MSQLRKFPLIATRHLQKPMKTLRSEFSDQHGKAYLRSWCSWTTFDRLSTNAGYWTAELPLESELGEAYIQDGGTWGQPFGYEDELAHIIIPRKFCEEHSYTNVFRQWTHEQDIDGLSKIVAAAGIEHRISKFALEVKYY